MYKKIIATVIVYIFLTSNIQAVELGEFNSTKFKVGGYVKVEGRLTDQDSGDDGFEGSARQSRINFSATREIEGHTVTGFVEGDFYGNSVTGSPYDWRLRHAFIKVDNLTMGQTWNGQFFAVIPYDVPTLDFWNAGKGTVAGNGGVVRPDLVVHYATHGLRLSLQQPVNSEADYPDFVVNYAHKFDFGLDLSVAFAGRDVAKSNATNDSDESEFGAAAIFAGKYSLGSTSFHLNGYSGEGQGIYSGFGYGGAWNPVLNPVVDADANGNLIKTTGGAVGVSHSFSEKLRGAIRYAEIKADETEPGVDDVLEMTNVNLVYTYLPDLDFGVEWRDQNFNTHPIRPSGQQVEIMAMYKF